MTNSFKLILSLFALTTLIVLVYLVLPKLPLIIFLPFTIAVYVYLIWNKTKHKDLITHQEDYTLYDNFNSDLLNSGEAYEIDNNYADVDSRNWIDTDGINDYSEVSMLNSMVNRSDLNQTQTINYRTRAKLKTTLNNNEAILYSPSFNIDPIKFRTLLTSNKTSTLYIDKQNPDRYYWNIEFNNLKN